jgi:uncharacterized membrane protein
MNEPVAHGDWVMIIGTRKKFPSFMLGRIGKIDVDRGLTWIITIQYGRSVVHDLDYYDYEKLDLKLLKLIDLI